MRLLMSYLMSVPGIPCVYYGDEIADVGGNDPDNRRMMRFANLNEEEMRTKQWTSDWANLRRSRMSMLYGTTTFEIVDEHVLHIQRTYLNEVTDLYLNRDSQPHALPFRPHCQIHLGRHVVHRGHVACIWRRSFRNDPLNPSHEEPNSRLGLGRDVCDVRPDRFCPAHVERRRNRTQRIRPCFRGQHPMGAHMGSRRHALVHHA